MYGYVRIFRTNSYIIQLDNRRSSEFEVSSEWTTTHHQNVWKILSDIDTTKYPPIRTKKNNPDKISKQ